MASRDGVGIAYQVRGDGPPLLLLAGQANNHHWWDPIRGDFETRFSTITLDWRGTGDSDKPDEPYSTQEFADDAIAVLDDLEIESADIYGTSMGGRVAQWLAIRHPERVLGDPTMPTYARARHLVASNNHDAWQELQSIKARTLILHGADDIFSPAGNAELLAQRIPDARAHVITGARHAYFHEFQTIAGPLVQNFLTSTD